MEAGARRSWRAKRDAVPNNLPRYLTSFVGRARDLSALKSLLARSRLVTFVGPGGAGKTRLAVELCWTRINLWPEGVWWVDLAPIDDSGQVPGAIASVLKLPGRGPAWDVVMAWLAAKRSLLILDNCEHLIAFCAEFCQAALERCGDLTIIATSRQALGVPGEVHWPVSSLAVPDAVRLFEVRAALVEPGFKLAPANLSLVTEICDRIDRLPLAIELAAARVDMMTEHEILNQLTDRFPVLGGGSRTAPTRLQAMSAAIDWSYRLLTEDEARLFRRLAVFRGGFTLEGVQTVCADGIIGSPLDLVAGLVHKSMLVVERTDDSSSRYRLLESQLAYAENRLRETGELELICRRHYEYYLDCLGAKLGPRVLPPRDPGVSEAAWMAREWANLWAAVGWARTHADDLGLLLALRLAESASRFRDLGAIRGLLADLLEHSSETGELRINALWRASDFANVQGDYDSALRAARDALALARQIGDVDTVAYALLRAGNVLHIHQELDVALAMYEEAIALIKGSSNLRLLAVIRNNVGLLAVERGDYTSARDILVEAVATVRAGGDALEIAGYLDSLAWAQLGLDDRQAATANWKESLSTLYSVLDYSGIITCFNGLSCVAAVGGDDQRAMRLAAFAARVSAEWALKTDFYLVGNAEELLRRSRSRLGTRKSEEAWYQGRAMTIDQAIDYALHEIEPATLNDLGPLSRREREVAILVAAGLTNREIAERLFIAERSAEGHVERIRNKLGVRSRTEVATWAVERRLLSAETAAEPRLTKKRGTRNGPPSIQRR
jgi:predicted ATPase/DNA-binding CsgD family transcriptional regulator